MIQGAHSLNPLTNYLEGNYINGQIDHESDFIKSHRD